MRVMLFFDLPNVSAMDIRAASKFTRIIKKNGYIMSQYSVYTKLVVSPKMAKLEENFLKKLLPNQRGNVQIMTVTENQFASIVYLCGENKSKILSDTKKIS
jgi:CRISPR-associated protein Cas2